MQIGDENGLIPGELGYGQIAPNCTVQIRGHLQAEIRKKTIKLPLKTIKEIGADKPQLHLINIRVMDFVSETNWHLTFYHILMN